MNKLIEILSKLLMMNPEHITNQTSPSNTENWDSVTGLMMVSELERAFGIKFTTQEIVSIKCVGDIRNILINRGIKEI